MTEKPVQYDTRRPDDEIDLRELVEVLVRRKWIVALITVLAVGTAAVYSFFLASPRYEAATVLLVSRPELSPEPEEEAPGDRAVRTFLGTMSLETFREKVTNPVVLQGVIDRLGLDPREFDVARLERMVSADLIKDTNLLRITVSGTDPVLITRIANAVADEFVVFFNQLAREHIAKSADLVRVQLDTEAEKLAEAVDDYRQFLAQSPGVRELEQEVASRLELLTRFRTRIVENRIALARSLARLEETERQLAETPVTLETRKTLADDPLLFSVVGGYMGSGAKDLAPLKMSSEELNPVYLDLAQQAATLRLRVAELRTEQEELQRQIAAAEEELKELQAELAAKQVTEEQLAHKVELLRANYQAFVDQFEASRIAQSLQLGETSVAVVTPAWEPTVPVAPNKKLNLALAAVLGVMVGVFAAFGSEFFRRDRPEGEP